MIKRRENGKKQINFSTVSLYSIQSRIDDSQYSVP